MSKLERLGVAGALLFCIFIRSFAVGAVAEIATFPPDSDSIKTDHVVYSMQFSADSSHLLVIGGVGRPPLSPDKSHLPGAIWDVGKKQIVSAWSNANVLGSGAQEVPGNHIVGGWLTSGPAICDSATGIVTKPGPLDGLLKVYCTAQALSDDGALLAIAWNQAVGKSAGTKMQFRIGLIGVWDVKARKWKWRMNGAEQEGENNTSGYPTFHDQRAADRAHVGNLAFSPDGRKLAAVVGTELHVLALEEGKATPALVLTTELHHQYQVKGFGAKLAWVEDGSRTPHLFQWLANGTLLKQKETAFVYLDAATGKVKEWFDLADAKPAKPDPVEPPRPAPKPAPRPVAKRPPIKRPAPPKPAPQTQPAEPLVEDAQLLGLVEFSSLSAQAKSLAVLYRQESDEFAVAIWDVAARHQRGVLKLPVEPFGKGGLPKGAVMVGPNVFVTPNRKPGEPIDTRRGSFPIALSPDGKHLAVPDRYGVIHVYDVAQIEATAAAGK